MVTRGWVLHNPRVSAASKVATPLHGEIAPFRLISPPMKFPPQAVIGGSSPPVFPLAPSVLPGGKTARNVFLTENPARAAKPRDTITVGGVPPTPPSVGIQLDRFQITWMISSRSGVLFFYAQKLLTTCPACVIICPLCRGMV